MLLLRISTCFLFIKVTCISIHIYTVSMEYIEELKIKELEERLLRHRHFVTTSQKAGATPVTVLQDSGSSTSEHSQHLFPPNRA